MKFKLIVAIFFAGLFSSCTKDFLDVNNTQALFRESYVKDLVTMQEYMRGAYLNLSREVESKGEQIATYPELAADNLRPISGTSSPASAAHYNWNQAAVVSAAQNLNALWIGCYQTIRMCNFIIDNVDDYRGESPLLADDLKGQALALRAYLYFKLVNTFAQHYTFTNDAAHPGVPYITTADITQPYTRQSVNQVYANMIVDIESAIQLLPATTKDTRYMNSLAAKALLARVYLFKEDFANAKIFAIEVVNAVPLMTTAAGYPNDIFKFKGISNTETLFQITPRSANSLGRWLRRTPIRFSATRDLAIILQENLSDIRKDWVKDTVIAGGSYKIVKKFPAGVTPEFPDITTPDIAYYTPILRSSEMYLTAAEAAAKTGDEITARNYLNAIRKRANPTIADISATGTSLIDSIYKERRKELSFEGLRMFDLQRWKMGVNRTDVLAGSPNALPYPSNKAIAPIPMTEVSLAGIPQNTGY